MRGRGRYRRGKGRGFQGTCFTCGKLGHRFYEFPQHIIEGSRRIEVASAHIVKGDTKSMRSISKLDEIERESLMMNNDNFKKPPQKKI